VKEVVGFPLCKKVYSVGHKSGSSDLLMLKYESRQNSIDSLISGKSKVKKPEVSANFKSFATKKVVTLSSMDVLPL
jgi:hypothetical protein